MAELGVEAGRDADVVCGGAADREPQQPLQLAHVVLEVVSQQPRNDVGRQARLCDLTCAALEEALRDQRMVGRDATQLCRHDQRHPELQKLFGRRSAEAQQKMLLEAIAAVVDHLDDLPWLEGTLHALAAKHVSYGVTDEMYPMVAGALMDTLRDASGSQWNAATHDAWLGALTFVAERMQAGARDVASAAE